jgi:hypothetical protein
MTRMIKGTAALLLAMNLAGGIVAPAAAQTQPPAQSAATQTDPVRLAAARDLLVATNTDAQFSTVIPLMFGQMKQMIPAPADPKMKDELNKVFDEVQTQFIVRRAEVLDQIAVLYAQKFSAEEMKALADFYRTPIGQKFINAMPELTAEAIKMGNAWGQRIAMDAERKIREEMKKRGFDL